MRAADSSIGAKTVHKARTVDGRHHRPRRVGRGVAKGAAHVRQRHPAGDMDDVLANAFVFLALAAKSQVDWRLDRGEIVQPVRQLELERAPVADIDEAVDAWKAIALAHTPQQRLGRRACLGGIEADAPIHRAHRLTFGRRRSSHRLLGRGQRRVETGVAGSVQRVLERQHAEPDDGGQLRRDADQHGQARSALLRHLDLAVEGGALGHRDLRRDQRAVDRSAGAHLELLLRGHVALHRAQDDHDLGENLGVDVGVRADRQDVVGERNLAFELAVECQIFTTDELTLNDERLSHVHCYGSSGRRASHSTRPEISVFEGVGFRATANNLAAWGQAPNPSRNGGQAPFARGLGTVPIRRYRLGPVPRHPAATMARRRSARERASAAAMPRVSIGEWMTSVA